MKESIKTGGVGKSPIIEKINRLTMVSSRMHAAVELEKKAFQKEQGNSKTEIDKRKQIIEEFQISFKLGEVKDSENSF